MKMESFKAGRRRTRYQYKGFEPFPVNCEWTWEDPTIGVLLERASRALGELNAFSLIVPGIDLFIEMHVVKEAQTSSRIEGTQTAMGEVLLPVEQILPERRDDWREVHNYIDALNEAVGDLKKLPLSSRLLKKTHTLLMRGVRGEHKNPGEFRTSQNWIGGSGLMDAAFIPPHPDGVPELMGDLEKFWHNETILVPHLIRAAISHYQFETIHPFLDGNGRIGRLFIPLYLIYHGILEKPSLYLSDFFERNRGSYYDALTKVRESNDLIRWVRFFLSGIAETATKGRGVFDKVIQLRNQVERHIFKMGKRGENARNLLHLLYKKPVTTVNEVAEVLNITFPSACTLLKAMSAMEILTETTGQKRNRVYTFEKYLELFMN